MLKSKKYQSLDHVVVRQPHEGKLKKDWTGAEIGWITVVKHSGFNYRGKSVYLCRDIFGEEFNCVANRFTSSWFKHKVWTESSWEKVKKLRETYHNMIRRCYDPDTLSSKWYYEKGVTVCDEWLGEEGFNRFATWAANAGYRLGLTIDKSKGAYSPETCRWVTGIENRRDTSRTILNSGIAAQIREAYNTTTLSKIQFCMQQGGNVWCTQRHHSRSH